MTRSEMKRNAKARLGNGIFKSRWLMGVLVCLIMGAVAAAAGTLGLGVGAVIIIGPMTYGLKKAFLTQARKDTDMDMGMLFSGFSDDFGGIFLLGLMSGLFEFLWGLLFFIPGIVKTYAYAMIYYIKADHPEYNWRTCLQESEKMMKGHKWQLFVLDLSFIGWYLVGALCLSVGDLWVAPYHEATKVQFYMNLCGERLYAHQEQTEWHDASLGSHEDKDTAEEEKASWNPER